MVSIPSTYRLTLPFGKIRRNFALYRPWRSPARDDNRGSQSGEVPHTNRDYETTTGRFQILYHWTQYLIVGRPRCLAPAGLLHEITKFPFTGLTQWQSTLRRITVYWIASISHKPCAEAVQGHRRHEFFGNSSTNLVCRWHESLAQNFLGLVSFSVPYGC